ncbi:MAG TPA: peptidase domain-containing ABC transporter [Chitinophagaceae bacterium]
MKIFKRKFPFREQLDAQDCGPSCIRMIANHYGKNFSLEFFKENCSMFRQGISLAGLSEMAEKTGFRTLYVKVNFEKMVEKAPLPAVAHWDQDHFIVVYKIKNNKVYVADPAFGLITYTRKEFLSGWANSMKNGEEEGILLLLQPTPELFEREDARKQNKASFAFLTRYLLQYKRYVIQLCLALLFGSVFQLIFPFLTQFIVDYGIANQDINFIYIVLLAKLTLFVSSITVEFIQAWILIHISSRINVYIISDFLIKLMHLPIRFFDTKLIGDLTERIQDHKRIEQFLTETLLQSIFSVFSILVFGIILATYNVTVFLIFLIGTFLELVWIFIFLGKMRHLDNKSFALLSADQSKIYELITGMQEIKLNNIERQKRWEWERIQAALFMVNLKKLKVNQFQNGGSRFLNYLQVVLIIFIAAMATVQHTMTLGTMMAIIFVIGQLNAPIGQLINLALEGQLAKISLERLSEIHSKPDEEEGKKNHTQYSLSENRAIDIQNVSFTYAGNEANPVLNNINLFIPQGSLTAIVGVSGSGKTTLLKLLLKFYEPQSGTINIGDRNIECINSSFWREKCGTVMQDSFIFSDTIANNIALKEPVNEEKLLQAVKIANAHDFIESLPLKYNTRIGQDGVGISQGQRQRILIARAVYKDPEYLFFDEATNALDAENELVIMRNLESFFKGRTVIIVAHRLSTVKNADQIIVIDKGRIIERDNHEKLIANKLKYYELIRNQLELGN